MSRESSYSGKYFKNFLISYFIKNLALLLLAVTLAIDYTKYTRSYEVNAIII